MRAHQIPDARRDANDAARNWGADAALCTDASLAALESQMTAILSAATVTPQDGQTPLPAPAFTLFMQRDDGHSYLFNNLDSTPDTSYQSASTSKLVSAAIILSLVDRGVLSLDDHPQKYISWPAGGAASQITLRQLLAFVSGLNNDPPTTQTLGSNSYTCIDVPPTFATYVPWAACVTQILNANFDSDGAVINGPGRKATAPGTAFYYSSNHLQVAGLMALAAAQNWASRARRPARRSPAGATSSPTTRRARGSSQTRSTTCRPRPIRGWPVACTGP